MEAVLLVVHLIIALGIIILVLVQPAESGGFLGQGGSMSNMMAPRRSGDVLTRATGIFAALFFITSLLLAVVASMRPSENSILDEAAAPVAVEQAVEGEAAVGEDIPVTAPVDTEVVETPAPTDETPKAPIAP